MLILDDRCINGDFEGVVPDISISDDRELLPESHSGYFEDEQPCHRASEYESVT